MVALLALTTGCATIPPGSTKDSRDPLERLNRTTFAFDDALAHDVAIPIGHAYTAVTPTFVRRGIAHVFENLHTPAIMVNDLLQGKLAAFGQETTRLLLNTTIGFGGLLDPASGVGLPKDDNDFGRTLGTWGLHTGPYLILPLFGPSDFRDGFGRIPDSFMSPQAYIGNNAIRYGIYGVDLLNTTTETIIPVYKLLDQQQAYDRYGFARNAYLQQREYLVHGDQGTDQDELDLQKSLQDNSAPAPAPTTK
jgi:phospholipid-binding lipoprotein MlaA